MYVNIGQQWQGFDFNLTIRQVEFKITIIILLVLLITKIRHQIRTAGHHVRKEFNLKSSRPRWSSFLIEILRIHSATHWTAVLGSLTRLEKTWKSTEPFSHTNVMSEAMSECQNKWSILNLNSVENEVWYSKSVSPGQNKWIELRWWCWWWISVLVLT